LQRALDSRVLIEQAKGALAEALTMTMEEAFSALRSYARNHNMTLHEVASGITTRRMAPAAIVAGQTHPR
jgi:AmiR/NasT family two-component response regulator